jgi:hypothetical protein
VHYNREKYREKLAENIPTAGYPVRILTDDQALLVRGNDTVLLGDGREVGISDVVEG